jgi:hypothetical protein
MPPAGFEPAIPASEQLQTHVLVRAATGIGESLSIMQMNVSLVSYYVGYNIRFVVLFGLVFVAIEIDPPIIV